MLRSVFDVWCWLEVFCCASCVVLYMFSWFLVSRVLITVLLFVVRCSLAVGRLLLFVVCCVLLCVRGFDGCRWLFVVSCVSRGCCALFVVVVRCCLLVALSNVFVYWSLCAVRWLLLVVPCVLLFVC